MAKKDDVDLDELIARYPGFKVCPDYLLLPPMPEEIRELYPDAGSEIVSRCMEMLCPHVTRGANYMACRGNGESGAFAEMISLQQSPGSMTDDDFFRGHGTLYDQFGSQKHLDKYIRAAKSHGHTPSVNSVYFSSLARFPGDPEAFVTQAQGRGYIRRLCEKRGWACDGDVKVEAKQPESDPHEGGVALADDLVDRQFNKMASKNPELRQRAMSPKERAKIRKQIVSKHSEKKK